MSIIQVIPDNASSWAQLCNELWGHHSVDEMLEGFCKGEFKNEFLYLIDDIPIAFISLSFRTDYVEGTKTSPVGYLEGIYVKPEYRNKGNAKELVEYAKKRSIQNGCSEFASDCVIENEQSRAFHNKIGFKEANTIVCFTMQLCTE